MSRVQMQLEMLEQERDALQLELTTANDLIFKQRKYIINCKQIIKQLSPSVQLTATDDLETIDISDNNAGINILQQMDDLKNEQKLIKELQAQQNDSLSQLSENYEMVIHKINEFALLQHAQESQTNQIISNLKYHNQQLMDGQQLEHQQVNAKSIANNINDELLEQINQQHRTINDLNEQIDRLDRENAHLQDQIHKFQTDLHIIQQNIDQNVILSNQQLEQLMNYQKQVYMFNLSRTNYGGTQSTEFYQTQLDLLKQQLNNEITGNEQNEELIQFIITQYKQSKRFIETEFSSVMNDYKLLYSNYEQLKQQQQSTCEANEQHIGMLEEKYSTLAKILSGLINEVEEGKQLTRQNSQELQTIIRSIDQQTNILKINAGVAGGDGNTTLQQRSIQFIERKLQNYMSQQTLLMKQLSDQENSINQARASLGILQKETVDTMRNTKLLEIQYQSMFNGLKEAVTRMITRQENSVRAQE